MSTLGKRWKSSKPAWNKGLTKETDSRVELYAAVTRGKPGRRQSEKTRQKLRDITNAKVAAGTWHNSFSRSRTHEYKGIRLYGLWEVAYAKHLDATEVEWVRPKESFPYIFEGEEHRYTPDFYLPATDTYVEVKGLKTPKDEAKWNQFPKRLKVVRGKDLFELGLISNYKQDNESAA